MPSVVKEGIPVDIRIQLDELDSDLKDGDITRKGYCKKSLKLLELYLPPKMTEELNTLKNQLNTKELPENDYCEIVLKLLKKVTSKEDSTINENCDENGEENGSESSEELPIAEEKNSDKDNSDSGINGEQNAKLKAPSPVPHCSRNRESSVTKTPKRKMLDKQNSTLKMFKKSSKKKNQESSVSHDVDSLKKETKISNKLKIEEKEKDETLVDNDN